MARKSTNEELVQHAQAGDEKAIDELLRRNRGLMNRSVRVYARNADDAEDLEQEARLAILHAIKRFRSSVGCKFSTYVVYWIREAVHRASRRGQEIKLPVGETLTDPPRSFQTLDAPLHNSDLTLGELVADQAELNDPASFTEVHGELEQAEAALKKLAPEARRLIRLYFGIEGNDTQSYKRLARQEGCSYEYLQQKINSYIALLREEIDEK